MIDTVIFDLDGTLLDTKEIIIKTIEDVFLEHLKIEKPPYDELVKTFIGPPLITSFKKYIKSEEEIQKAIAQFRLFNKRYHDDLIKPFNGAEETLYFLKKRNIKIGVVSSKLHEAVVKGLELTKLIKYIDVIIGLDDCIEHKPSALPVLKALEELGSNNKNTLLVGDHPNDIISGRLAGVETCAVTYSDFLMESLAERPEYVIDELNNLKDFF